MSNLSILEEPQTFPPKKFFLIIWGITIAIAFFGIVVSPGTDIVMYIWMVILTIALWQLWTIRWVQIDNEGIRMRNLFKRGRELRWNDVHEFHEEEVRLSGRTYVIVSLSNKKAEERKTSNATRINITSDLVGFDVLRDIVREAVPKR